MLSTLPIQPTVCTNYEEPFKIAWQYSACRKPPSSCACAHKSTTSGLWPSAPQVPVQYQTPRRSTQQFNFHTQSTPHLRTHTMTFHPAYPHQMYDPRLQVLPISSAMQPPLQTYCSSYSTHSSTFSQATPIRQSTQTSSDARRPLSPAIATPAQANCQKRKRSDGAKTTSKRTKQTQPQFHDENTNPSLVPGVGPSSQAPQAPAARPKPIVDYSQIRGLLGKGQVNELVELLNREQS